MLNTVDLIQKKGEGGGGTNKMGSVLTSVDIDIIILSQLLAKDYALNNIYQGFYWIFSPLNSNPSTYSTVK